MSIDRRTFLTTSALLFGYAGTQGLSARTSTDTRRFVTAYDGVLGTSLELSVVANASAAEGASARVLAEIARQASLLSAWDRTSEFSRWAATEGQAVRLSPELFEVLGLYDRWRTRSGGALNAGAEGVIQVWRTAAAEGRLPLASELSAARDAVDQPHWHLNPATRSATRIGNAPLVLASLTKSYILDKAAAAALLEPGVDHVVVNIGGDIAVRGPSTEVIDIVDPRSGADNAPTVSRIAVSNRAIATSGNYRRGFDIAGRHYSHIVDPRTGLTADNVISATVVGPDASEAGALATAFSILTPRESEQLAAGVANVDYLIIERDGRQAKSRGWSSLEASAVRLAGPSAPAVAITQGGAGAWDPSMELTISFETPVLGGPAKRPFVAAWIEDADRFPVKTLALWYHEDRYLTEMKAWYRADRLRSMSEGRSIVRTVSSATRAPGKYTLKWDGRDNDGKPVPAGKYTVYLEVSREHGGYEVLHQDMTFAGTPQTASFKPGAEIAAASFDYHKVAR